MPDCLVSHVGCFEVAAPHRCPESHRATETLATRDAETPATSEFVYAMDAPAKITPCDVQIGTW